MNTEASRAIDDEPCHCGRGTEHTVDVHRPPRAVPPVSVAYAELSDLESDAITVTTKRDLTWITCTSGADEVTVGPIPTRQISAALPAHPAGPAPDRGPAPAAPSPALLESALAAALKAEKRTIAERDAAVTRAEKAEQERDEAEDALRESEEVVRAFRRAKQLGHHTAADDERIQAWEELVEHPAWKPCFPEERALIDSMMDRLSGLVEAEQAHRQMPDVTDEMVERFRDAWQDLAPDGSRPRDYLVRVGMRAALTEPPTRPEWEVESAERIKGAVWGVELPNEAGETGTVLAGRLARHGYKVVPATWGES